MRTPRRREADCTAGNGRPRHEISVWAGCPGFYPVRDIRTQ
jgi:hypothetical protein